MEVAITDPSFCLSLHAVSGMLWVSYPKCDGNNDPTDVYHIGKICINWAELSADETVYGETDRNRFRDDGEESDSPCGAVS